MRNFGIALFAGLLVLPLLLLDATAQTTADKLKTRINHGTIGIISGGVDGTYIRIAADLSAVLDNREELRILPVVGKGSVQNLTDLLYLRGIDVGIVQSDVLAYVKSDNSLPGIEKRIQYIAKLYNEEIHVLARSEVHALEDLRGKKVNFDVRGSGTFMTATVLFDSLKIKVEPVSFDQALALEKLRSGEIAALVYVAGKPARLFRDLKAEDNLHFVPIPLSAPLLQTYLPSQLTPQDYGFLDAPVETIAVGAVMAVVSFPPNSERYHNLARFTDAFFDALPEFREPPRHPKWKEVHILAEIPGWTRFPPAEAWVKRQSQDAELRQSFTAFIEQQAKAAGQTPSRELTNAIFEEFLRWKSARH